MNGDCKIRESKARGVVSKTPPFQIKEKENINCGKVPDEKQKKIVRFCLCTKADTMNFRRRIKSDCGTIIKSQRAPLNDLELNFAERNASKMTGEHNVQAKINKRIYIRPTKSSSRILQQTISSAAKMTQNVKETKQSKPTIQPNLNNDKPMVDKTQENPIISEVNKLKSTTVKQASTSIEIQENTTFILPAPTIFTSTLFIQSLNDTASNLQVEACKKKLRPRTKSLNIDLNINLPIHDHKISFSNNDCVSDTVKDVFPSPIVTIKPIIPGIMSPIKPNSFTTEQTLLAQPIVKPAAKKETLTRKAHNNTKNYKPFILYNNLYESDYSKDIIAYLLDIEQRHMVKKHYLQIYDVNSSNRTCIVDWLLKIQGRYKLSVNVYLLAIRLFDALLAAIHIPKNMYQLISLTVLWIIHKFDCNTKIIEVEHLLSDCYNVYNPQQILHMEQKVIKYFNFDYNLPEPMSFLFYFAENLNIKSEITIQSTCYILESYALTEEYSTEPPSLLAAASLHLSIEILFTLSALELKNLWRKLPNHLAFYSMHRINPVKSNMQVQLQKINNAVYEFRETYNKYKVMTWFQVFQQKFQDFQKNLPALHI